MWTSVHITPSSNRISSGLLNTTTFVTVQARLLKTHSSATHNLRSLDSEIRNLRTHYSHVRHYRAHKSEARNLRIHNSEARYFKAHNPKHDISYLTTQKQILATQIRSCKGTSNRLFPWWRVKLYKHFAHVNWCWSLRTSALKETPLEMPVQNNVLVWNCMNSSTTKVESQWCLRRPNHLLLRPGRGASSLCLWSVKRNTAPVITTNKRHSYNLWSCR